MIYYGKKYPELTIADRGQLEAELRGYEEIKDKLRYIGALEDDELFKTRKEEFEKTINNRIFYRERNGTIQLVKPFDCTDFTQYNSCKVIRLSAHVRDVNEISGCDISYTPNDTQRVDMFNNKYGYSEITDNETLHIVGKLLHDQIDLLINKFKIKEIE